MWMNSAFQTQVLVNSQYPMNTGAKDPMVRSGDALSKPFLVSPIAHITTISTITGHPQSQEVHLVPVIQRPYNSQTPTNFSVDVPMERDGSAPIQQLKGCPIARTITNSITVVVPLA
jgi:hypothetical protein